MELFRQLDNGQTDKQTNKQTNGRTLLVPKVAIATEKVDLLPRQQQLLFFAEEIFGILVKRGPKILFPKYCRQKCPCMTIVTMGPVCLMKLTRKHKLVRTLVFSRDSDFRN